MTEFLRGVWVVVRLPFVVLAVAMALGPISMGLLGLGILLLMASTATP